MPSFESMVVFGDEWGLHPTSTQHITRRLAERGPVIYVNAAGTRPPTFSLYDVRRIANRLHAVARPHPTDGAITFHSPFIIPFNNVAAIRHFNRSRLVRSVRQSLTSRGLSSPILFVVDPTGAEVAGAINESLLVYYITDEYAELPNVFGNYVRELEASLLDQADLIFVTSRTLQSAKTGRKAQPILLPHGVDFEHFSGALRRCAPVPPELEGLPRPILGFYGLLAPWVDRRIFEYLAAAMPRSSVVLVGPVWGSSTPPCAPNIHWLGPRSYDELPKYAAHFDVALIPFVNNKLTENVNPLKFLEYLALGLPVVSTPLPDLEPFGSMFYRAETAEEFVQQVKRAIDEDNQERRNERMATASRESWETRVETVMQAIQQRYCVGQPA